MPLAKHQGLGAWL